MLHYSTSCVVTWITAGAFLVTQHINGVSFLYSHQISTFNKLWPCTFILLFLLLLYIIQLYLHSLHAVQCVLHYDCHVHAGVSNFLWDSRGLSDLGGGGICSLGPFRRLKSSPLIFHCFYFPNFLIYMAFFFYLIMVSRLIGYLSFLGSLQNYHSSHNAVYHSSYTQFLHLPSCATCHRVYS